MKSPISTTERIPNNSKKNCYFYLPFQKFINFVMLKTKTFKTMNCIKSIFIALLCLVSAFRMTAQTSKPEEKITKTAYYYKFEGAKSLNEVNLLGKEVNALKGVTEFKTEFKPESNFAQIIVVVMEKTRTSEGDVLFEITDLKKILEKKGYLNLELTSEELPFSKQ